MKVRDLIDKLKLQPPDAALYIKDFPLSMAGTQLKYHADENVVEITHSKPSGT